MTMGAGMTMGAMAAHHRRRHCFVEYHYRRLRH